MVDHYSITHKGTEAAEERGQKAGKTSEQTLSERTAELEDITLSQSRKIEQQGQEIDKQKQIELELKRSLKWEELTNRLNQAMGCSSSVNSILESVAQEVGTFFELDRCMVICFETELEQIEWPSLSAQYCRSEAIEPIKTEEIPWEISASPKSQTETDKPLKLFNTSDSDKFSFSMKSHLERFGVKTALVMDIKFRDIAFGRLILYQCHHPRLWAEYEIGFLKLLAGYIGSALYQAKLFQEQRQAKQEAEEANRQKSKILSYVSHDFKNPLDSMKRFIDMLEKDQNTVLPEKHREIIGYIGEGVHQLRIMVTNILDKARLEEGRIMPEPKWIDIIPFIDELKPTFHVMASQRNVEVNIEIQPELAAIKADPTHLRQILINLLSNAVKYNRVNGKVFLKLFKSEDRQFIVIEVQDTGLGIPSDKMPQLFTEYFRADLSQTNPIEGSGLGLSFIKKLIELSGGTITVESIPGEGSTFTVHLPS